MVAETRAQEGKPGARLRVLARELASLSVNEGLREVPGLPAVHPAD